MFAEACARVSEFTRPVVISRRSADGGVSSSIGAFIVVNEDGWIITAGHNFDTLKKFRDDAKKIKEIEELNESRSRRPGAPQIPVRLDPGFIVNHSFWWGRDGWTVAEQYVNRQLDVAVARIEGFDPSWVSGYPVFRDPDTVRPGTSLCRAGYALLQFTSTWDAERNAFVIPMIDHRESLFFNEGIHTRTVSRGRTMVDDYEISMVETSSVGLKGQSGGPIFDTEGRVYAMQTLTQTYDTDLRGSLEVDGSTVVEHQFVSLGSGVHVRTLLDVLDRRGVGYRVQGRGGA